MSTQKYELLLFVRQKLRQSEIWNQNEHEVQKCSLARLLKRCLQKDLIYDPGDLNNVPSKIFYTWAFLLKKWHLDGKYFLSIPSAFYIASSVPVLRKKNKKMFFQPYKNNVQSSIPLTKINKHLIFEQWLKTFFKQRHSLGNYYDCVTITIE